MRYKPEFQDIVFTVFLLLAMVRAEAAHVALVIGNSSYDATTGWWPLRNPGRDADAMSAVLRDALGFDRVLVYKDLDRRGLVDAIEAFDRALGEGDTAVFYYSGHGAYAGDGNYLVPTSARAPRSLRQLRNDSVALREITDVLATNKTALNVVVLDACRNNPLSRDKSFGGGSLRGTDRADFHGQTIIGYATAANRVAQDGDGQLSPYTAALSEVIADRHLNLWEVFGKVNVRVKEATHNSDHPQEPWKEDNFGYPPPYLAGTPPNPEGDRAREARDRAARHANAQAVRDRESRERSQDAARHSAAIEPEMVSIRGGRFWMGSPEGEDGRDNDERRHEVRVGDFRLGRTEVTQAQWRAVMGNNPSENQGCDRCPVERVSWYDVQEFLAKLNSRTGGRYRLPKEVEWEYACRGGSTGELYCGGDSVDAVAWYSGNSGGKTHPVGQKRANGFGLHDMSGNVWEWTCSEYDEGYNGGESKCMGKNNANGRLLVARGGSWYDLPRFVRSANRYGYTPDYRNFGVGFRLAQD